ncbi:meiosis inhibitor protein 1 isoform X2 [Nelusetta ayraudi]|uniref:meiosis inhibitor protein 1 isoform X2 n=1 Tax=Nelusetta ayraudi TaxID=303726 RepID=UPI003F72D5D1
MSGDIVYDKFHFRHDSKWSGRLGPAEGGGLLLCVACVIEMIESDDIAVVRKSFALSGISGVLKCSPGAMRELLRQDHRVGLRLTASLLVGFCEFRTSHRVFCHPEMFRTVVDSDTLQKVGQVLIQLLAELQGDLSHRFVLDEIHKQLRDQLGGKSFLPTFSFLGSLIEAVPDAAHSLVTQYVPMLDHLCSALLHPDDGLKASVLTVWLRLHEAAQGAAVQALPAVLRDRVCVLLLQTLSNASSPPLIHSCVGLLWVLLKQGEAVSVLMDGPGAQHSAGGSQGGQKPSQNQEQQSPDRCPLPLILKKLLLSGDETLQTASAKCIAAALVHSAGRGSAAFIEADIPEFLFDRLAATGNEVLLWSVYSCLLLLTEDGLFFSQCHSVYGIDSLVRSLKEALRLTTLEVPKQGLLLLTEILERQPSSVHLFSSGAGFAAASEAVAAGVSSSCLLVATQAAAAAAALFRLNHQPRPVQYREMEAVIEAATRRFSELPLPARAHRRSSGSLRRSEASVHASRPEEFLLSALLSFEAACRLAEECASDPLLKENSFTAPSQVGPTEDTLESLSGCLLRCCDSVWIPTVLRMCEGEPNPQVLQNFYAVLSSQFALLPSLTPVFASKLASSGFYRLALEHKGLLCAGNRNPGLNASCSGFLQKLSVCLLSQPDQASGACQQDAEEAEALLLYNLPSLCYRPCDWPALLREAPGPQLCEYKGPRATQYCLLSVLHLAHRHGDRPLSDQTVFSSVAWLLRSVQEQGDCAPPRSVLRSALYLLAAAQDKSPDLDEASLNCVSKAMSSCQNFSSLYFHHPALLFLVWRYPELADKFGSTVLELWLIKAGERTAAGSADGRQDPVTDAETEELLSLIKKHPTATLTLLKAVCAGEALLAGRALAALEALLSRPRDYDDDLSARLKSASLQALQRLSVDNVGPGVGQGQQVVPGVDSLPLVLKLLCATQASDLSSSSSFSRMDGVDFKLLYHVSNVAGRLKPADTGTLLPALNYLHCCLSLSPAHCADRAVSMLLSNGGLMGQLQMLLSSTSTSSSSLASSAHPPSALLCCGHLLLSSLITLQRLHPAQVPQSVSWNLEAAVQQLLLQKRNTDDLLLASRLRMLQALLDADFLSAVVCVSSGPGLVGPKPLGAQDGALYPLGSRGAQCLSAAISGLLLQRHELLLNASVNCLGSLLAFLQRKSPCTARYVSCQPWSRFLLRCLLDSGESCLLHPVTLRVIALLLKHGSTAVPLEPDVLGVIEAAERRGLKQLSSDAAQALGLLLSQVLSGAMHPPPTDEHRQRVRIVLEALQASARSPNPTSNILRVGDVFLCVSDFVLK